MPESKTEVLVHDISVTGLLLETSADLVIGDKMQVDLPEDGPTGATVIWNSGRFFGCEFDEPVAPAAVSAALLKSPFEPLTPQLSRSVPEELWDLDGGLSARAKAWILVGLVVATWLIIFAVIEARLALP